MKRNKNLDRPKRIKKKKVTSNGKFPTIDLMSNIHDTARYIRVDTRTHSTQSIIMHERKLKEQCTHHSIIPTHTITAPRTTVHGISIKREARARFQGGQKIGIRCFGKS